MAKQGKEKRPTKPPLVHDEPVAESVLTEGLPTKPPLVHGEPVAESVLTEGGSTKPPLVLSSTEPQPESEPE